MRIATGYEVERLDTGDRLKCDARDVGYFFAGCGDVVAYVANSEAEARAHTEQAWGTARGTRLFGMIIDPAEDAADLIEVGEALDELLCVPETVERVKRRLFAYPLPAPIDFRSVSQALETSPTTRVLLEEYLARQNEITRVHVAFNGIPEELFARGAREHVREVAIETGCFKALVQAAAESNVNRAVFALLTSLRTQENFRAIVQAWTEGFKREHLKLPEPIAESDDFDAYEDDHVSHGAGGRQAFEQAKLQQAAIVDRIRAGDFVAARRFAKDMVNQQRKVSAPEHIAKSLTNLSQRAKLLAVYELALEWAHEASEYKLDDPRTHAQVADILMRLGRFVEAEKSLDLAASFGDVGFAATGRARIMRLQDRPNDALAAYRTALEVHPDDEHSPFIWSGIAECLRDLNRLHEALETYEEAIKRHPLHAAHHAGHAATLAELGMFEEALRGYQDAINLDDDNVVPRNGIATIYRRAGKLDEAEQLFREIIVDYPFDIVSRVGLNVALRRAGRVAEAILEARHTCAMFPGRAEVALTLADALIEGKQLDEAQLVIDKALLDFPHVPGLVTGSARIAKARGRYADALALYDAAAERFKGNDFIQVARADMMRRLGHAEEALGIYERARVRFPERLSLLNGMASVFIYLKRFDEARALLTVDAPHTIHEWRNFFLHGMLDDRVGNQDVALSRFAWGMDRCPFARERALHAAAHARLQLQIGNLDAAAQVVEEVTEDFTGVIRLHALAAQDDQGPARALYNLLLRSFLPEHQAEVRDEIARHYRLNTEKPRYDDNWILGQEADVLVLEAA